MESRQSPRFPIRCSLCLSGETMTATGTLLNISSGGWMVESNCPVRPGMHFALRLSLPDSNESLAVEEASVQWARGHKFGVKPIRMSIDEWKRLRQFYSSLLESSFSRF